MVVTVRVPLHPGDDKRCIRFKAGTQRLPASIASVTPGSSICHAMGIYDNPCDGNWVVSSLELNHGNTILSQEATVDELLTILDRTKEQSGRVLVLTRHTRHDKEDKPSLLHCHSPRVEQNAASSGVVPTTKGFAIQETSHGKLEITNIQPRGLFSLSNLKEGMHLVTVGGVSCQNMTAKQASQMINEMNECIDLEVEEQVSSASGSLGTITVSAIKTKAGCGVAFTETRDGFLVLDEISPNGVFAGSLLEEGMKVISINGILCSRRSSIVTANSVLSNLPVGSRIALVVQDDDGPANMSAVKQDKQSDPTTKQTLTDKVVLSAGKPSLMGNLGTTQPTKHTCKGKLVAKPSLREFLAKDKTTIHPPLEQKSSKGGMVAPLPKNFFKDTLMTPAVRQPAISTELLDTGFDC